MFWVFWTVDRMKQANLKMSHLVSVKSERENCNLITFYRPNECYDKQRKTSAIENNLTQNTEEMSFLKEMLFK